MLSSTPGSEFRNFNALGFCWFTVVLDTWLYISHLPKTSLQQNRILSWYISLQRLHYRTPSFQVFWTLFVFSRYPHLTHRKNRPQLCCCNYDRWLWKFWHCKVTLQHCLQLVPDTAYKLSGSVWFSKLTVQKNPRFSLSQKRLNQYEPKFHCLNGLHSFSYHKKI